MTQVLSFSQDLSTNMSAEPARRHFTVTEYYRMGEAGIFSEDDRVELIQGDIVEMSPIGIRHASCVDRLAKLLQQQVGQQCIVRVQNPVRLNELSEPQPDIALLKQRDDFYATRHPLPEDVLLIVEVAETSAGFDRKMKAPLYAAAGIPELWIIDLIAGLIEIHSQPLGGSYQWVSKIVRGEMLVSNALSGSQLSTTDIFGS
ncbi:MAG TPA: Uma2 family endonuclease [Burkholderiales bacterium]|nr:Uma2 family endonuclease [Burkholderiales bacterium]